MLKRIKELLGEVDARTAAKHITLLDCKVTQLERNCSSFPHPSVATKICVDNMDANK